MASPFYAKHDVCVIIFVGRKVLATWRCLSYHAIQGAEIQRFSVYVCPASGPNKILCDFGHVPCTCRQCTLCMYYDEVIPIYVYIDIYI